VTTSILPHIQYSCSSCNDIFNTTDSLRQHLFHAHQILFPFSAATEQYQSIQLSNSQSNAQTTTATIQPGTQQYTFTHPHKKYFDSEYPCLLCGVILKNQDELIKHMSHEHLIKTTSAGQSGPTTITVVERDIPATPTDLSNPTQQYK